MTSPRVTKLYTGPTTAAKAYVAAAGATLTALMAAVATATVVLDDDKVDFAEIGSIATAVVTLAGTIYGVWAVRNRPVSAAQSVVNDL